MAETIGLIASVSGIAAFGAKLSLALYEFASVVASARSDIISIGQEISLSCVVMQQLRSALDGESAVYFSANALQTTNDIVNRCLSIFTEIEDVLVKAKNGDTGDATAQMGVAQRVAWVFRRTKIRRLNGSLDALKMTLQVMLMTLQLSHKVYSRRFVYRTGAINSQ